MINGVFGKYEDCFLKLVAVVGFVSFIITFGLYLRVEAAQVLFSYSKNVQEMSNWCWVASAQNAVKYTYTPVQTQSSGVRFVKGSIVNEAGSLNDTKSAAMHMSYGTMEYDYNGIMSFSFLKGKINDGYVSVLGGIYSNNSVGHMVSMHGYYENGSYAKMIWYYDPGLGTDSECSYSSFLNGSFNGMSYVGTVYCVNY